MLAKIIPPWHLQKLIPLMYTSCIDWKFSCAIEETHSILTLSPDREYFMAEEAEKTDPRVWLPVSNSRVTLPLMLGLETYCWRVRQGTPENSPGHGVSREVTMWNVLPTAWLKPERSRPCRNRADNKYIFTHHNGYCSHRRKVAVTLTFISTWVSRCALWIITQNLLLLLYCEWYFLELYSVDHLEYAELMKWTFISMKSEVEFF